MAFIIKKKIKGKEYYYLRESRREGNKIKAKTIAYLGKNKVEAQIKAMNLENIKKPEIQKPIMDTPKKEITIDEIATFCKRKGFVYPSSEIYGGLSGFWDFGPLGIELFNNIKKEWWSFFVQQKDNMFGIDASIVSNPKIWKASGHIANFSDVSVRCKKCKKFSKVDKAELHKAKCAFCKGELDKATAKDLNLMLKTQVGPIEEDSVTSYLRPETAQGMFTDFKIVTETSRAKLPFGIAQIGKCFRNEIAPRDFMFRCREFHIGEFEFFIHPSELKCNMLDKEHMNVKLRLLNAEAQENEKDDLKNTTIDNMLKEKRLDEWHAYWLAEQILFFKSLNINMEKIKIREHMKGELSHYSSATFDLDYEFPFGSHEVAGNANRGQYDLTQHAKESSQKLDYFDEASKIRIIPRVIEPTFGMERLFLMAIVDAYTFDAKRNNIVLKIHPKLAPIKAAVFPIVNQPEYENMAKSIVKDLKKDFNTIYDGSGSIGRRYSRNDEAGTPFCITIDDVSPKQKDVTIRDRDTTKQIRVKTADLKDVLRKLINKEIAFEKAGKLVETRVKE
jgi:glycyl-tRNA synthetase